MSAFAHVLWDVALPPDLRPEEPVHLAALQLVQQVLAPLPRLGLEQTEVEEAALALALVARRVQGAD
eukprot:9184269-Alexandrium_andersonii.AAC.1